MELRHGSLQFVVPRAVVCPLPRPALGVGHSLPQLEQPIFDLRIGALQNIGGREMEDNADGQQPSESEEGNLITPPRAYRFRSESVHAACKRPLMNATLTAAKAIIPPVTSVVMRTSASLMKKRRRMTAQATVAMERRTMPSGTAASRQKLPLLRSLAVGMYGTAMLCMASSSPLR